MPVLDPIRDVAAGTRHRHPRPPSTRSIARHQGSAQPKTSHPQHKNAAAIVHLASHIPNKTLARHLLHYAFPTDIPKPKAPITDAMLHELAVHIDQAVHHVGHPTRPAIVTAKTHEALVHGIQAGVSPKAKGGGLTAAQGKRLTAAALKEARGAAGAGFGRTAEANAPRTVTGITQSGHRHHGTHGSPIPAWAATAGDIALALLPVPKVGLAGRLGTTLLRGGRTAKALSAVGRTAEATRGGRAVGGAVRAATERAGASTVGRAARTAAERTAPLTRPAGTALKYAGKHPVQGAFGASVGAQVPAALAAGDPSQLLKGLEGTGALASILGTAGKGVSSAIPGVAGRALSDLISLPAQVPPSVYLTGKAGVEAAGGNSSDLNTLIANLKQQDPLGALVLGGNPGLALHNLSQHPVYGALEALGVKSALGHAAGRTGRALGVEAARTTQRPPLHVYGDVAVSRGPYSRDLIQAAIQKRLDVGRIRKRPGPQVEGSGGAQVSSIRAKPHQASRALAGATDRAVYGNEQVRSGEQAKLAHALEGSRPADQAQADVVSLLAQRIARSPESAVADLRAYREHLNQVHADLEHAARTATTREDRGWAKVQLNASRNTASLIDKALKNPNPEALAVASDAYIRSQAPIVDELVKRGLLSAEQAHKATLFPFARMHMGAGHGLSNADAAAEADVLAAMKGSGLSMSERGRLLGRLSRIRSRAQLLKPGGEPLSAHEIAAEMGRQGVGEPGFVTQRLGSKGSSAFFRAQSERPRMPSQRRTGSATTKGTLDPSWQALVEHAVNSRSILDMARGFDAITKRFGIRSPSGYFKSAAEARLVAEHPEDYGINLPPVRGGYVPFRIAPWLAKKAELAAAKKYGDPAQAELLQTDQPEAAQLFMHDAVEAATKDGKGDTVLIPKVVADRLRQHFAPKMGIEKTIEATTGMFKGAILPTSPGWAVGNVVDNYVVRMFGTGLSPRMIGTGKRFSEIMRQEMGPEEAARAMESITPGGMYGSYKRIQPYRASEQFAGTALEPLWNAAHAIRQAPGLRQAGDLYRKYADAVFNLDSRFVEQTPQFAELSRTAQHDLGMTRRQFRLAVKAGDSAVRDLARGLRNTNEQVRYAKRIEATFGNWGKSSPAARRFLTTWAPFWMWSRAATKFVFVTLPRDHPIITALYAASEQMTRPERQKFGFDFQTNKPLPDWLQGALPLGGGGAAKVSNLTSFGYAADLPSNLASVPAPQFSSFIYALNGLDWKGDKLVDSQGRPASEAQRVKTAIATTAESFVPFLNVANSIKSHGVSGISPVRTYPKKTLNFLRDLHNTQTIQVPISKGGSSSSSTNPFDSAFGAPPSSSSSNPFDQAFGSGSSSSGSSNPFDKVFK